MASTKHESVMGFWVSTGKVFGG